MFRALDTRHLRVDECAELHRVEMSPPTLAHIVAWHLALAAWTAEAYGAVDADINGDGQFWFVKFHQTDGPRRLNPEKPGIVIGIAHTANLRTTHSIQGNPLQLSWTAVDNIMQRAVQRGQQRQQVVAPKHMSIDETSFQRRYEYVTVVTDQETGTVAYVADGRKGIAGRLLRDPD